MNTLSNVRPVTLNEQVLFQCKRCGGCCRNVKDSIMLEPMDIYRLSRHLRKRGDPFLPRFRSNLEKLKELTGGGPA